MIDASSDTLKVSCLLSTKESKVETLGSSLSKSPKMKKSGRSNPLRPVSNKANT